MRLLFIRHAEPDYSIDSLTPIGFKEAELLAEKLKNEKIDYVYKNNQIIFKTKDLNIFDMYKINF